MKKEYLNKNGRMKNDAELSEFDVIKRNNFLKKQLHGRGMNKQVLESIEEIMGVATNPRERARALKKALEGTARGAKEFKRFIVVCF
jgi:Zn-dependent M32 family carboxypeptidase